ncbi:GntR family transcriptional regulator [Tropicimonas isoalkanivorans]|uniref:Transcriptional regulator, GntR family n=1 Tax=Tropicimonas isoalkanivorans TaxID=441112 RepID=A0A1I1IUM8_9RHOB|nr:GntR family transcriptional regulator [Tropicimonas isoalkanivorans]SFC39954.1 transcriptional regulator, GntR family [Tropicimonas isoalkanivorans]
MQGKSAAGWGDMQLDQSAPIGPQLHGILRARIVRNDLKPGAHISEAEVAKSYAISRQPVREAFIKLAEERLIEIRPQRSTVVRKIDCAAVLDIRFVREAIEADIVRLLATAPDTGLVARLRELIGYQRAIAVRSPSQFIAADEAFHEALADGAGKKSVWYLISGLKSQMDRVRYLSFEMFPHDRLIEQHAKIVDAIEAGDTAAAEQAIRRHLREVLSDLPDIMRAHPDAFTTPPPD